ncbi:BEACH domain-containing protein B [Arabidopsis thaliana]
MESDSVAGSASSSDAAASHLPSVSVLLDALEQSASTPRIANGLSQRLLRSLQFSNENKLSFKALNGACRVLRLACIQAKESRKSGCVSPLVESSDCGVIVDSPHKKSDLSHTEDCWFECVESCVGIFTEFFSSTNDAKVYVLRSSVCVDCLFELFWEKAVRNNVMKLIIDLMKIRPLCEEDKSAKLQVCSKYLETFTQVKERENDSVDLSVDLLAGMRDLIKSDSRYYQALFREGECFLHIVSLLNGNLDEANGEKLVLNVLQTLTSLLANNDTSKFAFKALAGKGYQTLQSLLLDFFQWKPTQRLLDALLDMLVDGKFDDKGSALIKNEDVIILYLNVLQKSSESLQCYGLNLFQQLLRDSISNRASCVRAGMLHLLLDWFSLENDDSVILKITQLTQTIGGHSISGKDIRKIFALLRSERVGNQQRYRSLLLACLLSMLNEKGPTGFFDMNGVESGIVIRTPVQWPANKGFSFCCWLRVESFPGDGKMGIFSFMSKNGKGCFAALGKDGLSYVSLNLKRQCVNVHTNLVCKKWHFICVSHSIGRAFWGGSLLRCYVNGDLVSSERCSYPKVTDVLTSCLIGTRITLPHIQDNDGLESIRDVFPFFGQIGPVYLFNDSLSSEQVQAIYSLGPSYMYAFLENEMTGPFSDNPFPSGILDGKDGLASKVSFGLNAQASDGRRLFNVSRVSDHLQERLAFEADIMVGTQLCSRRLLQQIIYCVGGISVFFPLITQSDRCESEALNEETSAMPTKERMTAEVIELIASVLDENPANQQQMHLLAGFPILGFLLQSIQPKQLNLETLSSLKHLFNVISSSGFAEQLVEDAISSIFLNPHIWLHAAYNVQRELYMFLIQQLDNDPRLLGSLCRLPRVIDIVWNFYWESERYCKGSKPLMHPTRTIAERPSRDEIHKIRLLLLSLGEMSLRQNISSGDVKALTAFFETCQDVACIEDVLHMVIRAISQTSVLVSFLEQVNLIGGCHIFVDLLQRDYEPIRLLSLQFLGRLLYDIPSERKGPKFFNLAVGRTKSLSQGHKKIGARTQPIFLAMSDRLFQYPQTDNLRATLFDVLLGGASPKQVLQKHNQVDKHRSKPSNSHFFLPQIFVFIFEFLSGCKDGLARMKIISDILDLLDSNPMNVEALMEFGWSAWLTASMKLDVIKDYRSELLNHDDLALNEQHFVRGLFCVVLCHYILSVKGGWQQLEETVNFILLQSEHNDVPYRSFLRDLYEDLIQRLVELSSEDNIFLSHPCRDNVLYLLRLVDEMLVREFGSRLLFPAISTDFSEDLLQLGNREDPTLGLDESFQRFLTEEISRNTECQQSCTTVTELMTNERWWNLYDNLWKIICDINGRGPIKMSPKSLATGPSIGQRARGLVESLNVPAAEMAAVVVSGGIGSALSGKMNKNVDKAMLLRGEKCPRIVFRLVTLYLCMSSLEKATRCVQQVTSLLPSFLAADDEQSKSRLHLFIGCLLYVRSQYGKLDDGARFHVISHLIRETVSCGKSILATSGMNKDDSSDSGGIFKEMGSIQNLIHKDRVLAAVTDETTYMKTLISDRTRQVQALGERNNETLSIECNSKKAFDGELQNVLKTVVTWDENRRVSVQLSHEEQQQNVTEKWIHMLRSLMDERGPWSATPFPNNILNRWKLDRTEDSWRRRPKLRRNYHFDERLCHPPSTSTATENETSNVINESKSGVIHIPEQMKKFLLKGIRRITDEGGSDSCENDSSQAEQSFMDTSADIQFSELVRTSSGLKDVVQDKVDASSLEVGTSEVLTSVPCVLVTPKRKLAGWLAVMKNVLHFSGEFLVEGTGGSAVFKNFSTSKGSDVTKAENKQNLVKWSSPYDSETFLDLESGNKNKKPLKKVKRHRRWKIGKVKSVHWTRYLLQYTALEIFFQESVPPVFLNFASQKNAKEVGMLIVSTRNEFLFPKNVPRDRTAMISFVDRRIAMEMAETARDRWRRREITNFEYLMILNTLAGRSYNDLTQYPVFPWVVADYSSETLDFSKASTFRDLSKPVGALDTRRFEIFEDRYHSFSDPDIPSFYYGSHYSSMGSVLYYLLRLEPFTSLHRSLQGGKFDHADRLFQSVEGSFRNCLSNTSDVKELIPEFFYMPEFLVNSNSYHLGVKQDGEPLGEVCLPPWAKGSPEMFIARNREALESEYVSSHLHDWIDLIFGHKQRGKPAVEAANIFYYLTYEGAVDVENMEDQLQISAIEDQIANFGQTPIQIFRKKHPRRGPPIPIAHPLYFAPASINLSSILPATTHSPSAVLYVGVVDSNIVLVNQGLTLSVKIWLTTQLHSGGNFTFSSAQDPFFGVGSDVLSPRNIGSPLADNVELGSQCFAAMQTPLENFLVSCGNWENSFHVISLTDGRVVQSIRHHKDVVSCVAVTADSTILATGSYDTTVMVWDILRMRTPEKRVRNTHAEVLRKDIVIADAPSHILCGHDDIITCLYVSTDLDIVISGSKDGTCVFHTLREGRYIRSLKHPSGSAVSKLAASHHGRIVLYGDDDLSLHLYSINGKHLASSESNGRINCLELSKCGEFLVSAGDQGQIIVRSMNTLEVVKRYNGAGKIITSLTVTQEECFLAGTKDGALLVYSIENPQHRKPSPIWSIKS